MIDVMKALGVWYYVLCVGGPMAAGAVLIGCGQMIYRGSAATPAEVASPLHN